MALNKEAHARVAAQFEARTAAKTYCARVWGVIGEPAGEVDLPLGDDRDHMPRQRVDHERGKHAQTRWEVIARETQATRVRLFPLTGRTHQLRVHMLALGHPILGDALYAHEAAFGAAGRLQLHAESLTLLHPADGRERRFAAPCPF